MSNGDLLAGLLTLNLERQAHWESKEVDGAEGLPLDSGSEQVGLHVAVHGRVG
jgi:hypothetical protein